MVGVFGKKIGMTQLFRVDGELIPVTAIDVNHWYVVGFKTTEKDGYSALCVGLPLKRLENSQFSSDWLKNVRKHFYFVREVACEDVASFSVGQKLDFAAIVQEGQFVNASGTTKGRGFQGVVKRHGFRGGPASHGGCLGRIPGSIGAHRSQGSVNKGKKLPGHMGVDKRSIRNLEIVKIDAEQGTLFVKGSMPGHIGSLIFLRKSSS